MVRLFEAIASGFIPLYVFRNIMDDKKCNWFTSIFIEKELDQNVAAIPLSSGDARVSIHLHSSICMMDLHVHMHLCFSRNSKIVGSVLEISLVEKR